MSDVVKNIQINISADTSNAYAKLNNLQSKLESLKSLTKGSNASFKFKISKSTLENLDKLSRINTANIANLSSALASMSAVGKMPTISKGFTEGISRIHDALATLTGEDLSKLDGLSSSLQGLNGVDVKGLTAMARQSQQQSPTDAIDAAMSQPTVTASGLASIYFGNLSSVASSAFEGVKSAAKSAFSFIGRVGKVAFATIGTIGKSAIGALANKFGTLNAKANKAIMAISRIALYRTIRRAIQLVTQAFTEGVKNIYAYSQATGTALAPNLDTLSSSLMQMKNSIGSMAAPLINALTPAINTVINAVSILCDKLAQLFALLSGSSTYSKAISTQYKFGDAIGSTGSSASGAKSQMDKFTAGIDELNVIDDSSSSSGGGGSSYDATTAFEEATAGFGSGLAELISEGKWSEAGTMIAEAINQSVASIDFATIGTNIGQKIQNALEFAAGFLQNVDTFQIGQGIATSINNALNEIDFELAGDVWIEKWNKIIEGISGFAKNLDWSAVGSAIGDFINGALENFNASELAQGASALASGVFDMISEALQKTDWTLIGSKLKEFFENVDWAGVVSSFFELLGSAFGAAGELIGGVIQAIADGWQEKWEEILSPYIDENGTLTVEGFFQGIKDALTSVGQWIVDNIFDPFIKGFKKAFGIASPSKEMETQGGYVIDGLWQGIKNAWHKITEFFTEKLNAVKESITQKWTEMKQNATEKWNEIKSAIGEKWSAIYLNVVTTTSNIKSQISGKWEEVKSNFSTTWELIKTNFVNAWSGMKDGIKTPMNAIIGYAESLANGVIKMVNKMVDAINDLCDVDVPEWVPEIGGQHFGLNLPHVEEITIPRLENGGFTDADLFYANENGMPEMVGRIGNRTAVANSGQIIEGIASGVTLANGGVESLLEELINVVEGKNFSVSIGSKEIGQANEEYTRTRGVYVNRGVFANAY